MPELILYGHRDSGHACKVALALTLAGLPFATRNVDIWADPATRPSDFLSASPFAEVPLLLIDGQPFTQSGAILLEIAARYACLGGETPDGMRRAREVIVWEANRIGMCLPQLKEARRVQGEGFPPGVIDWLRTRFDADCARFAILLGDRDFLHGDRPGAGDCAVWGYTQWLSDAGVTATPVLQGWIDRMRALPGMKRPEVFFPDA